ncbi:hypothetical protein Tco_0273038 [Tanacetum coccineum]
MTTIVFTATTPQNTPSAYRASTLANPNPMISPAFVVDYDKERKMEPRPEPNWEDTLPLRLRSHVVRRQRERIVGFEEALNREGSRGGRNAEAFSPHQRSNNLVIPSSLYTPTGLMPIHVNPYSQPSTGIVNGQPLNFPFQTQIGNPLAGGISAYHSQGDHRHDTNDSHQLRNQIEEAIKSGQLSHLVKGIKKERVTASENQRVEGKKDKGTVPAKAPILMIRKDESYMKNNVLEGFTSEGKEITFPSRGSNSSALVIIKAKIFGREVSRVHMDSGSSCDEKNLGLVGKYLWKSL